MSSTQESDGSFQSWFGSSRWKTALYIGLPLLGVGVVGVLLWRRQSGEDSTPEQPDVDQDHQNITTGPDPDLVWNYFYFIEFRKRSGLTKLN